MIKSQITPELKCCLWRELQLNRPYTGIGPLNIIICYANLTTLLDTVQTYSSQYNLHGTGILHVSRNRGKYEHPNLNLTSLSHPAPCHLLHSMLPFSNWSAMDHVIKNSSLIGYHISTISLLLLSHSYVKVSRFSLPLDPESFKYSYFLFLKNIFKNRLIW